MGDLYRNFRQKIAQELLNMAFRLQKGGSALITVRAEAHSANHACLHYNIFPKIALLQMKNTQ